MRSGHITLPKQGKDEAAEAARSAAYERKQKWKAQPGNRYTPEELKQMGKNLGVFNITEMEADIMVMD